MVASEMSWGQVSAPDSSRLPPPSLLSCERMVAVTVHLPELLLASAGLLQRLGAAGVTIDILVAAASDGQADRAAVAALEELRVPGLERHRLALPTPIGPERGDDLIAAMSELVGFDPDPGLYCLAPDCLAPSAESGVGHGGAGFDGVGHGGVGHGGAGHGGAGLDGQGLDGQGHAVVAEAASRICQIYRLPLVRFTSMPYAAVESLELDADEWARKCAAVATCASHVMPLTGRHEYFGL